LYLFLVVIVEVDVVNLEEANVVVVIVVVDVVDKAVVIDVIVVDVGLASARGLQAATSAEHFLQDLPASAEP
jgi:hypothetical protein